VSSVIGPILPPSIPLVLYALVSGTSIGYLFMAGVLPGLLLGVVQMADLLHLAKRGAASRWSRKGAAARHAAHHARGLSGAAAAGDPAGLPVQRHHDADRGRRRRRAVRAADSAGLYRSVRWRDLYRSLLSSARMSISIGMLIAGALVFNYVITSENIPPRCGMLKGTSCHPILFLLLVKPDPAGAGRFLEGSTIILIILPVLLPTAVALGIDPVHFGVMAVLNIMIGLVTPPYGLLLFMMMKIADVSLAVLVREAMPFILVMVAALALVTVWPDFVLAAAPSGRLHRVGARRPGPDDRVVRPCLADRRICPSAISSGVPIVRLSWSKSSISVAHRGAPVSRRCSA
jgi:C4-dicarboxylate transporter DctM subunit